VSRQGVTTIIKAERAHHVAILEHIEDEVVTLPFSPGPKYVLYEVASCRFGPDPLLTQRSVDEKFGGVLFSIDATVRLLWNRELWGRRTAVEGPEGQSKNWTAASAHKPRRRAFLRLSHHQACAGKNREYHPTLRS
jgi:hypothetical protein